MTTYGVSYPYEVFNRYMSLDVPVRATRSRLRLWPCYELESVARECGAALN